MVFPFAEARTMSCLREGSLRSLATKENQHPWHS